jgi:hypothetical protein
MGKPCKAMQLWRAQGILIRNMQNLRCLEEPHGHPNPERTWRQTSRARAVQRPAGLQLERGRDLGLGSRRKAEVSGQALESNDTERG